MKMRLNFLKYISFAAITIFAIIAVPNIAPSQVSAHRSGCHRWHSCPSDTGSYVCGDLGYTSECGGSTTPNQTYVAPVKTSRIETSDSVVAYKTVTKKNPKEYVGFRKIITKGVNGVATTNVTVQLTDNVETSRSQPVEVVSKPAIDEVVEVGSKPKPVCQFAKIENMRPGFLGWNKGKYSVSGSCQPKQKIYLYMNGKLIGSKTTDKKGSFTFDKIVRADKPSVLILYDKNSTKSVELSKLTQATFTKKELKTL